MKSIDARDRSRRLRSIVVGSAVLFLVLFSVFTVSNFDWIRTAGLQVFVPLSSDQNLPIQFQPQYVIAKLIANTAVAFFASILGGVYFWLLLDVQQLKSSKLNLSRATFSAASLLGGISGKKVRSGKVASGNETKRRFEKPIGSGGVGSVINELDEAIDKLQKRSSVIYWTILFNLLAGVLLIIFAGYLSSFDTTFSNLSSQIQNERLNITETFGRMTTSEESLRYLRSRQEGVDKLFDGLFTSMAAQLAEKPEGKPVWNWPSTILRIGVIGLLVFLTQILISLYRYNSRLLAFYRSRRDALHLVGSDLEKLEALSTILYPVNLDFGREPRHPLQEMAEFLKKGPKEKREADGASRKARTGSAKPASASAPLG